MSESEYRMAWIRELKEGIECGTLDLANKRATLRSSQMTLSEYEQFRRSFPSR